MSDQARERLTLELESSADPITGRIRDGSGPGREFVGWLGLAEALERMLGPAPEPELGGAAPGGPGKET